MEEPTKATPESEAKTRKPGAPLQRTLIALGRAPGREMMSRGGDPKRLRLLLGYAWSAEDALAEAGRRLKDLESAIRETSPYNWEKELEDNAVRERDAIEHYLAKAVDFEAEGNLAEARHARSTASDARAEADRLSAIVQHFSKTGA
jgi:hypothetical protein